MLVAGVPSTALTGESPSTQANTTMVSNIAVSLVVDPATNAEAEHDPVESTCVEQCNRLAELDETDDCAEC